MATEGSDCVTGKWQFATKQAAEEQLARNRRRSSAWNRTHTFHCVFCDLWHMGNPRGYQSNARGRR